MFCKHCNKELIRNKRRDSDRKKGWVWESPNQLKSRKFCNHLCYTNSRQGKIFFEHTEETKRRLSESKIGKKNPMYGRKRDKHPRWKGGRTTRANGYIFLHMPDHLKSDSQGYVQEHILALEKKLGRSLKTNEISHHKNSLTDDNRPENLQATTKSDHAKLHNMIKNGIYILLSKPNKKIVKGFVFV